MPKQDWKLVNKKIFILFTYPGGNGAASASKSLCGSIAHHGTFTFQSLWWTTESSPVYASAQE